MPSAPPETRYAKSGDLNIAYQVVGEGPLDLIYVPGWISNVELMWEEPAHAHVLDRLASFSRLILFDKRGTGLSDPVPLDRLPTLEERMDDVRAVLDAVDCEQAALFGFSEGGLMSILFAATYPERITALVLYGVFAKRIWSPDYPWAPRPDSRQHEIVQLERNWSDRMDLDKLAPSEDDAFKNRLATYFRRSASPGAAVALMRMNTQIDVREVLPSIQAPTLVLHRKDDLDANVAEGRWIAERIPGAKFVELPGDAHTLWAGDTDSIVDEIEEFLTGARRGPDPDRVLATVLFTDIVGSTEHATKLGDRRWRELLERHHAVVRKELDRYLGRELDTAGDGFLATFDGPARAIRCACAVGDGLRGLGLEVRAGVHTGECELLGGKVAGVAVHTGARIAGQARSGEVLVSQTVKDLVAGSGIRFDDRGDHELKGVGSWRLYSVVDA
ncbi:MAG TPA: adenylate/guanylate cyclase domain-containing protein [Gaiellaceae bacterium]|jgi:pimeloyl-ACP methyl ester carboxylesterase|nr:adenylate/guanylate cyclase domain-containing protein [Gaiellaceae bacterium]